MSLFSSIQHVYASAAADIVKFAKFVENSVVPALKKVQANEATLIAVTAAVSPQAANIERVAFSVLGTVIKAVEDGVAAGTAGGINIALDQALIADIKAILPAIRGSSAVSSQSISK